ncbi:MAG: 3-phosphoshikimate 1-carboxyvinyltransferase [Planctomycetota bacterium]|jgi:3-phosphoshikimate 1-carboxyvinyltransferase
MQDQTASSEATSKRGLSPKSRIQGVLRTPGSKSAAQRALIAALLADGESRIHGLPDGADVTAAIALVTAAGAKLTWLFDGELRLPDPAPGSPAGAAQERAVRVVGQPPLSAGRPLGPAPTGPLRLGESGTLARIATAALALCGRPGGRVMLEAQGSLVTRSSRALFKTLRAAGVEILQQNLPGTWPVEFKSVTPPSTMRLIKPSSSQEVTALLIAAAAWPDVIHIEVEGNIPSLPYVNITRSLLEDFGAPVEEQIEVASGVGALRTYSVGGPLVAPPGPLMLEPDASSAAVALAAACLSGGALTVPGVTRESAQGDAAIVDHLAAFGCEAYSNAEGLHASGFPTRGADLDLAATPDLAPVLAAVAAASALRNGASSLLVGLDTLPGKESDRLEVLATGLRTLGFLVETGADRLAIAPPPESREGLSPATHLLDPQADHRMAFAFALMGLVVENVWVEDPTCVSKSWRSFWDDLKSVGAVELGG